MFVVVVVFCCGWLGVGGGGGEWLVGYSCYCYSVFVYLFVVLFLFLPPEGRSGMSDVTLLSGISGLSFDSPFLSPLLFFLPSSLALSVLSFFQKTLKYFSLRVWLFCMALIEQLGDDSFLIFYIVSVHSFFIFFFNLVPIN